MSKEVQPTNPLTEGENAPSNRLFRRGLSRRSVLRMGAMGAVGVTAATLLAACGGDDDDAPAATSAATSGGSGSGATATAEATSSSGGDSTPASSGDATATQASAPAGEGKPGGRIVMAMNTEPDNMDQHVGSSRYNEMVNNNIFDRFVEYDEAGDYAPGLAETWEATSDGLAWTIKIQEGVLFHDGTDLNAEAVKFNFDRIADPETNSQKAVGLLGPYGGTEVVDDFTVELTLEEVYAGFVDALASFYLVMNSPAAIEQYGADYGQHPVGTGPFMFKEWIQKDHLTLVKNPDYNWASPVWGMQGAAYLDEITFTFVPEAATRVTTLETGESDVIVNTPLQDYDRLNEDSNFTIMMAPVLGQPPSMIINTERAPTDDINVRKALNFALNQDEIIEVIYYGVYERAWGPLTQYNKFYDPTIEGIYTHDPDQAMALLEESGWTLGPDGIRVKDGQPLRLVYLVFPGDVALPELIQAQLRVVGIDIEILQLNNPANLAAAQAGDHNVRWLNWLFSDAGELSTTFHSDNIGAGWNFSRWKSEELDTLLEDGKSELDEDTRADIYSQIQHMVLENALLVPMYVGVQVVTMREAVKGLRIHRLGDTPMFYTTYLDE